LKSSVFFLLIVSSNLIFGVPKTARLPHISPASRGQYCAAASFNTAPLARRPVFSVKNYGAKGDGIADDTAALQKAFDQAPSGAVITFPKGIYLYSKSLTLNTTGIILKGEGGTLRARTALDQAIVMKADTTAIVDLKLEGIGTSRDITSASSTQIEVTGRWVQVIGNDVSRGASVGILVYGGRDFRIVGNTVHGTLADGIHMTYGAQRGLVERNVVYDTGDDMIAVVSYANEVDNPHVGVAGHILIQDNAAQANRAGRGITVVGGESVAIKGNKISDVVEAAGILVAQESSFSTGGVDGVLITKNVISRIETTPLRGEQRYTRQAAIDINTTDQRMVKFISVEHNTIDTSGYGGIRFLGNVKHANVYANDISNYQTQIAADPIAFRDIYAPSTATCSNNIVARLPYAVPSSQCSAHALTSASWRQFDFVAPQGRTWHSCSK
jgi:polygalacturonase